MLINWILEGLELHLEGIWDALGRSWAFILALLDASWLFFGRSKSNFFQALAQDGLQEGF